jgi:HEPN domain-containing protein
VNRTLLQQLAEERIRDAEALLNAGQWSGAYYLAGYAVECGLKACIAKLTNQHDFPDKNLAVRSHSHKILDLARLAGLETQRVLEVAANPMFAKHWFVVESWDEKARYAQWSEAEARKLLSSVTDLPNGVMPWIRARW